MAEQRRAGDRMKPDDSDRKIGIDTVAEVKVKGETFVKEIAELSLVQEVGEHHVLTVRLRRPDQTRSFESVSDAGKYTAFLGQSLSLTIRPQGGMIDQSETLSFTGIVTEARFDSSVGEFNTVLITAKSPTIALDGATENTLHFNMKGSDAIEKTMSAFEVTKGTVEATKVTFPYIVQYRETAWSFIKRMAGAGGLFTVYDGAKLSVVSAGSSVQTNLAWNKDIAAISLGVGTAPARFSGLSYSSEKDQEYQADSKGLKLPKALPKFASDSEKASQQIYKSPGYADLGVMADQQGGLDGLLTSQKASAVGSMVRCLVTSVVPKIFPGMCTNLSGLGDLDGPYYVTKVDHRFDDNGRYHNEFAGLPLDAAYPPQHNGPALTHLQTALVKDNNDPERLGRIKVQFRWMPDEDSIWMRYVSFHAGKEHGMYALPEVGDEVLVGFEFGNPAAPVALGSVYNKTGKPAGDLVNSDNDFKGLVTRSGHRLVLSDESGAEKIEIVSKDEKCRIVLDVAGPSISIETDGDISLSGANITLDASNKLTLKSGADTEIKASANLKEQASANVDIKGSGQVNVKGAMINLN